MQAIIYLSFLLTGCARTDTQAPGDELQAVRAVEVRQGPIAQGRRVLVDVVPERKVRVIAQVPGTVSSVIAAEGEPVEHGAPLVRISAPDIAARIGRVEAERARVEREMRFACEQLETDRVLAASGDLPQVRLDQSEKGCESARIGVEAATAAAREASVAGTRAVERAPFGGMVLTQLVDPGQTVMPGTPLVIFGSSSRQLRARVPVEDLSQIHVGSEVRTADSIGRVVEIGGQAQGPGRLVDLTIEMDSPVPQRPGTALHATLVIDARDNATSVPLPALGSDASGEYILLIEEGMLRRVDVTSGPRDRGWIAVEPHLPEGSQVVSGALTTLDLQRPVLAVSR